MALAAPAFAGGEALGDARTVAGGNFGAYDNGCTGGSCGGSADIDGSADGALRRGGLVTAGTKARTPMVAVVPAPKLAADKDGDIKKKGGPGFFGKIFGSKGFMFGAGGAVVGAGVGFLLGGPIGALIGAAVGALGGWLLSKFL